MYIECKHTITNQHKHKRNRNPHKEIQGKFKRWHKWEKLLLLSLLSQLEYSERIMFCVVLFCCVVCWLAKEINCIEEVTSTSFSIVFHSEFFSEQTQIFIQFPLWSTHKIWQIILHQNFYKSMCLLQLPIYMKKGKKCPISREEHTFVDFFGGIWTPLVQLNSKKKANCWFAFKLMPSACYRMKAHDQWHHMLMKIKKFKNAILKRTCDHIMIGEKNNSGSDYATFWNC